jgi:hypothetical protein
MQKLDEETQKEQKKRRGSTYKALGVAAIGSIAATVLSESGAMDYVTDRVSSLWNHDTPSASGDVQAKPDTGVYNPSEDRLRTGGIDNSTSGSVRTPNFDYSKVDLSMRSGAGLYDQFQQMDIPQSEWGDLLTKVGPQLHEVQVDGHPFAYRMANGEWGIRATPDGMLPKAAADKIMVAHQELSGGSGITSETVPSSVESPSGAASETTLDVSDTPATVESLSATVDHTALQGVLNQEHISASDIAGSNEFTELSHVASWYPPEKIAEKIGLSNGDWNDLQQYIVSKTNSGDTLYKNVFEVTPGGYLHFTTNRIPSGTMADILNHIPTNVRYRLTA